MGIPGSPPNLIRKRPRPLCEASEPKLTGVAQSSSMSSSRRDTGSPHSPRRYRSTSMRLKAPSTLISLRSTKPRALVFCAGVSMHMRSLNVCVIMIWPTPHCLFRRVSRSSFSTMRGLARKARCISSMMITWLRRGCNPSSASTSAAFFAANALVHVVASTAATTSSPDWARALMSKSTGLDRSMRAVVWSPNRRPNFVMRFENPCRSARRPRTCAL